uniref:HD superfamily metal-dependent phosphohydrolase, uncharacterized protein n=1 Tax=uncultured Microgenomates bacterium Rifle_16ft_4_minimus_5036 TaxID=1665119 RepID=A0A0H4TU15_9BACT|nr:HD superfamily metal-dependent phosphohydrolase, uncharacterized protein [uncultured Microgenomates bacterium Rifle_16ft_4_minimus_5036]
MNNLREKILKETKAYYKELDNKDFSHNFDHVLRVENMALRIGKSEGADFEILEAASLLFDVARGLEDKGAVEDHANEGSKIARRILNKIGFPADKIENVCHAVLTHRKSKGRKAKTLEAKVLQDADYLDALGAIAVIRTAASSIQSNKYKRPIYVNKTYSNNKDSTVSAIHYLIYMVKHPKLQPKNFHTALGRKLAKERHLFLKEFAQRFIDEWEGKR